MKSILQSIKPQYCKLIASGRKTIEVRKTKPKLETPFKVYIYCTIPREKENGILLDPFHPNQPCIEEYLSECRNRIGKEGTIFQDTIDLCGKVIGEYVCDEVIEFKAITDGRFNGYNIFLHDLICTCLSDAEITNYGKGKTLYGWHISDLKIYDKPKELYEFHKPCINPRSRICELCEFADFEDEFSLPKCTNVITGPPQSFCYVEEI